MKALSPVAPPLRLAEVFPSEATLIGLTQRTKSAVVAELVHQLVEMGRIMPDQEQVLIQMILAREKMGSTALGNGIAFPHCRSSMTETFLGVVGIDRHGVAFDALDGEPVYCIFLLLGPLDNREQHFDVLGRINAIGRDKALRLQLRGSRTPEQVQFFLRELDSNHAPKSACGDNGRSEGA
jgi:mannitol/fructose-specific phosphotransferase system IIA component (Ntr-type)